MIGSDLEGCGPSQPLPAVNGHHFTAPAERTPSRESASNGQPFLATMIGSDLEGCGPSQPAGRKPTPFHGADGADALQGIGQQGPFVRRKDGRWIGGLLRIGKRQKSDRTTGGPPVKDEMVSIMGRAIPGVGKQFKAETRRPDYIVGTSSLLSVYCVARSKSGIQNAFYRFVTLEIIENRP